MPDVMSQNVSPAPTMATERRRRAAEALSALVPGIRRDAMTTMESDEIDALIARFETHWPDLFEPLERLFATRADLTEVVTSIAGVIVEAASERPVALRRLDRRREIAPGWFADNTMVGYAAYADRFAGTLEEVAGQLDHLESLGVTYLHLLPVLEPRPGDDDGGYAVADYERIDPRLGTMEDLEKLAGAMRDRHMSLCIDLVVNHTAREHPWARAAAAGDPHYRDFYLFFEDRTLPDLYSETLVDVFPDNAPGNFTWSDEAGAWVWTTFHDFQWDLDHSNPDVFVELATVMTMLANRGVEVLRLDAVPFMWKEIGTGCQNLPPVHDLLQAYRAVLAIAAPAVITKAEAIVPPDELVRYLGAHEGHRRPECDMAYNNQLMVMLWSSVATRDARLAHAALSRMSPPPPTTTWATYVRCHDDIGWAVSDADAASVGVDAAAHRDFLNEFYAGEFRGSFGLGARFQHNPVTGDSRTSGSAAALCGIEQALDLLASATTTRETTTAQRFLDHGVRRLILLHAVTYGWGGVPLLWSGDEIASLNMHDWEKSPGRSDDNRWMHRPRLDWTAAAAAESDPESIPGRVLGSLRALAAARRETPGLSGGGTTTARLVHAPGGDVETRVLAWVRDHPRHGCLVGLANLSEFDLRLDGAVLHEAVSRDPGADHAERIVDILSGHRWSLGRPTVEMPHLTVRWLTDDI